MGRTVYVGRVLGFFESFPFFQIGRRLWARLPSMCLRFYCDFSPLVRVPLIMVPDSSPQAFGRVRGFGQRVFGNLTP